MLYSILFVAIFSLPTLAAPCASEVETLLKLRQTLSPARKGEGYRLNAMMRAQAINILKSEPKEALPEKLNWNRSKDLYFTSYSSRDGRSVALVFDRNGTIRGYRLSGNGEPYYQCLSGKAD